MSDALLETLSGPLLEALALAVYAILSAGLTLLGAVAEQSGFDHLAGGDLVGALWFCYVGVLALYAGVVMLGYGELVPRLREIAS